MERAGGTEAPARGRVWRFAPRPDGPIPHDEAARTRSRREGAARAGHGLGISFDLTFVAAGDPFVTIAAYDPTTERWVDRVLAGTYDPGQWRRTLPTPPGPSADLLRGHRSSLPGEIPGRPPDDGAVARTAILAFSAVRPGTELSCRVWPMVSTPRVPELFREGSHPDPVRARLPNRGTTDRGGAVPSSREETGPLWEARVELRLPPATDTAERRRAVGAAEAAWRRLDGSGLRFSSWYRWLPGGGRVILGTADLLALLPPKDCGTAATADGSLSSRSLPLGRTAAGAVVGIPVEPDQGRHLAVLGETGMGKSSLLVGLACRAARHGRLIVLDPLGETARTIREELGGSSESAVWIAPGESAPSINALDGIGGTAATDPVRSERRLADLVHALRRVRAGRYSDSSYWGPRLEEMLTRALRAAASFPRGTLADAHRLLSTSGLTRHAAPAGAEEPLRELAERVRERPEDADGARRLLFEVVRNPTLGRLLCDPTPDLGAGELGSAGRHLLVAGEAARVGESTARYLLAVYLALVWSELLASASAAKTFVVLDEAQWFAHESLGEMLRLARRRNVHVVLATQSIASLPEGIREAVWTNVADFVAFRGAPEEAREFSRAAPGIAAERLLSLARGEAAVLLGKGSSVRWVRAARLPRRSGAVESLRPGGPEGPEEAAVREPYRPSERPRGPFERAGPPTPVEWAPPEVPPVEAALRWLSVLASERGDPGTLRVTLAELRARFPEDPDLPRRVGARLGRAGGLRRTERTDEGTVWWLDPTRLGPFDPGTPPARTDVAGSPQPS